MLPDFSSGRKQIDAIWGSIDGQLELKSWGRKGGRYEYGTVRYLGEACCDGAGGEAAGEGDFALGAVRRHGWWARSKQQSREEGEGEREEKAARPR